MCADTACLVLRLEGPLQSWGSASQFNRRLTDLLPTRSGVMGLICAALGLPRGSREEREYLAQCASLHMKAVALPRQSSRGTPLNVRRLEDFHTVQGTLKATGGSKDCHITHRHYLLNAAFRVFLSGERALLERAAAALRDPVWGLWLGRKCCLPTAPVLQGVFATEAEALQHCLPQPLDELVWTEDVPGFAQGDDSVPDMPLSFASMERQFTMRRIKRHQGRHRAP